MSASFVLLHGLTGGPASWDALVAQLPREARILRPTLAGHGPQPTFAADWDAEVERIVALVRAERHAGATLVGYSLGGRLGYHVLARAPELFARAVLIGAHPGLTTDAEREARRAADQRWIERLERRGLADFVAEWERLPMWRTQANVDPRALSAQRALRSTHTARGLAHALRVLGLGAMPPFDPARPTVPILLAVGELDEAHRAHATTLAPRLPCASIEVVPQVGHNVPLEAPASLARLVTSPR